MRERILKLLVEKYMDAGFLFSGAQSLNYIEEELGVFREGLERILKGMAKDNIVIFGHVPHIGYCAALNGNIRKQLYSKSNLEKRWLEIIKGLDLRPEETTVYNEVNSIVNNSIVIMEYV